MCKKTFYYLYWINTHCKHIPSAVLKPLADSLVLSHFSYALPMWGSAITKTSLNRLQHQQNWAVLYTISYSRYLANCANNNTNDHKQVTIVQHTMESDSYYRVHCIYINQKPYNQLPNTIIISLQYLYETTIYYISLSGI